MDGEPLLGTWFDRTQQYLARRKGEKIDRLYYATPETVTFSPFPCWRHLSPEAYRKCVADLTAEIEENAATARKRNGVQSLGAAAILAQDPVSRLKRPKKSPAPFCHAASKAVRQLFYEAFSLFVAAYRTASEKLRRGDAAPVLPHGMLPTGDAVRRRVGRRGGLCLQRRFALRLCLIRARKGRCARRSDPAWVLGSQLRNLAIGNDRGLFLSASRRA